MSGKIELIEHEGQRLALIVRDARSDERVRFFSDSNDALQVGAFNMASGFEIHPHVHKEFSRAPNQTTEVLVMQSGRMRVDFYSSGKIFLEARELAAGDVIVLFEGGHGFTMLEDVRMLEIKQGPYAGDQDKERFASPIEA